MNDPFLVMVSPGGQVMAKNNSQIVSYRSEHFPSENIGASAKRVFRVSDDTCASNEAMCMNHSINISAHSRHTFSSFGNRDCVTTLMKLIYRYSLVTNT